MSILSVPTSMVVHMFGNEVAELADIARRLSALDLTTVPAQALRELLPGVLATADRLASVQAQALTSFAAAGGHEHDGCSTIGTWSRQHLRMSAGEIAAAKRAATALTELPEVAAAAQAGDIRPAHVNAFGRGIAKVGADIMRQAQQLLLDAARSCDPAELTTLIDRLHHAIDPDGPDSDWIKAQHKQDITCTRTGQHGYQVRGYLDTETGAKLRTLLATFTQPTTKASGNGDGNGKGADSQPTASADATTASEATGRTKATGKAQRDERPAAQRRVEGLATLLDDYLGSGLGKDKGERPHLTITTSIDELARAIRGDHTTLGEPATLTGHGPIRRDLLARIACDADLSMIITDTTNDQHTCCPTHGTTTGTTGCSTAGAAHDTAGGAGAPEAGGQTPVGAVPGVRHGCGCPVTPFISVLDVGRTRRTATPKQRLAVLTSQDHRCAMPGCNNRHLEIHHIRFWHEHRGPTDMDNLIGLCLACHTLIHRKLLHCTSDSHGGATFRTADGRLIPDIRRRALADYARGLGDLISAALIDRTKPINRALWHEPLPPAPPPPPPQPLSPHQRPSQPAWTDDRPPF
jgi:hypothetical protein